ncbi:hypothetical protein Hanom_Chr10g00930341 [Helianthus anomalus]
MIDQYQHWHLPQSKLTQRNSKLPSSLKGGRDTILPQNPSHKSLHIEVDLMHHAICSDGGRITIVKQCRIENEEGEHTQIENLEM